MEIPAPPPCPPRFKAYLESLRQAIFTVEPKQGANTSVSQFTGQGTIINAFSQGGSGGGGGGTGTITVSDGTTTLTGITTLNFDGALFTVSSGGAGIANITLITESCS